MTLSIIHVKTARGLAEVRSRSNALSPVARRVLIMIDGKRSEADLAPVVRDGELESILATLRSLGMIEECGVVDLSPPEPVDDEQTVMMAPPTMRLELGIAPARAAAAPPPPPPTLRVPFDLRPGTLGATPSPLVERRTPPNAAPPAPVASAAIAAAAVAATQAAAANSAGVVSGAATAPMVTPAAPPAPRVLPPANATPTLRRVVVAPAPPAEAAPPPAPAPSAKTVSFEETRRRAVSALYERLGPYGEEPAARLQDCKSLEALREQIEHACKRISTFRGEAAARDYLAGLGIS